MIWNIQLPDDIIEIDWQDIAKYHITRVHESLKCATKMDCRISMKSQMGMFMVLSFQLVIYYYAQL